MTKAAHPDEVAEISAQRQAGAVDALPHRRGLHAERLRHIGGGDFLEVAQHERVATLGETPLVRALKASSQVAPGRLRRARW